MSTVAGALTLMGGTADIVDTTIADNSGVQSGGLYIDGAQVHIGEAVSPATPDSNPAEYMLPAIPTANYGWRTDARSVRPGTATPPRIPWLDRCTAAGSSAKGRSTSRIPSWKEIPEVGS